MELRDVSDTARWVAFARALESERPDALFHDPFARRLAGERGEAIAASMPQGPLVWSLAVRTRVFDDFILGAVRDGTRVVVNLAAGLDARPYRLEIPADLHWIEVDLPGIVEFKNEALSNEKSACRVERVALDLSDAERRAELFARLSGVASAALVITEGLLVYLEEADVAALATDLRNRVPSGLWLLDNVSRQILAGLQRAWGSRLAQGRATHKFAPSAGLDFFHAYGWAPRATRSLFAEGARLRRGPQAGPLARLLSFVVPKRRRVMRESVVYALLEPRPKGDTASTTPTRPRASLKRGPWVGSKR